jgi:hypothetical protein
MGAILLLTCTFIFCLAVVITFKKKRNIHSSFVYHYYPREQHFNYNSPPQFKSPYINYHPTNLTDFISPIKQLHPYIPNNFISPVNMRKNSLPYNHNSICQKEKGLINCSTPINSLNCSLIQTTKEEKDNTNKKENVFKEINVAEYLNDLHMNYNYNSPSGKKVILNTPEVKSFLTSILKPTKESSSKEDLSVSLKQKTLLQCINSSCKSYKYRDSGSTYRIVKNQQNEINQIVQNKNIRKKLDFNNIEMN